MEPLRSFSLPNILEWIAITFKGFRRFAIGPIITDGNSRAINIPAIAKFVVAYSPPASC